MVVVVVVVVGGGGGSSTSCSGTRGNSMPPLAHPKFKGVTF